MGILDSLARRKRENRIKRKSRQRPSHPNPDAQIDEYLNQIGDTVYKRGKKFWNESQKRKVEGKQILKRTLLKGIGDTTRLVTGAKKNERSKK